MSICVFVKTFVSMCAWHGVFLFVSVSVCSCVYLCGCGFFFCLEVGETVHVAPAPTNPPPLPTPPLQEDAVEKFGGYKTEVK